MNDYQVGKLLGQLAFKPLLNIIGTFAFLVVVYIFFIGLLKVFAPEIYNNVLNFSGHLLTLFNIGFLQIFRIPIFVLIILIVFTVLIELLQRQNIKNIDDQAPGLVKEYYYIRNGLPAIPKQKLFQHIRSSAGFKKGFMFNIDKKTLNEFNLIPRVGLIVFFGGFVFLILLDLLILIGFIIVNIISKIV